MKFILERAVFGRNLTHDRGRNVARPVLGICELSAIRREPRTWGLTGSCKVGS